MMEAQPLETFSKETVAPATTNKTIISDVPKTILATAKNPGRVTSGKRLAERNRLAREAKNQSEAQKPTTKTPTDANTTNTTEQSSNNSSTKTGYFILGIGGFDCLRFGCVLPAQSYHEYSWTLTKDPNNTTSPS